MLVQLAELLRQIGEASEVDGARCPALIDRGRPAVSDSRRGSSRLSGGRRTPRRLLDPWSIERTPERVEALLIDSERPAFIRLTVVIRVGGCRVLTADNRLLLSPFRRATRLTCDAIDFKSSSGIHCLVPAHCIYCTAPGALDRNGSLRVRRPRH